MRLKCVSHKRSIRDSGELRLQNELTSVNHTDIEDAVNRISYVVQKTFPVSGTRDDEKLTRIASSSP